ncbi:hypothetical protein BXZ70DRAFT_955416 [Cristinia sonorae]|uniref:Uncharacterized protein n=1 Tax=Cristinia sonorae TaxID=1940300 RepID=A0A8K0XLT7_9AGAR|nr:hypothetical protein BXZ70DRAFT_955416 [Cristinia sonorae]
MMSGQMTPRTSASVPAAAVPTADTAQIRELLGMMKATLGTLAGTFQTLNEQSSRVTTLGPTMQHAATQIQGLRHQIRKQDRKQEVRMQEVRSLIQDQLKEQIARDMQAYLDEKIKEEIAIQVQHQVEAQMKEHVPDSLQEQIVGSRNQIIEVRHALMNSEARRQNSNLRTDDLNDQLEIVLKPDGTRSDVYPANLNALFAYSPVLLRILLRDHGLVEVQSREKNLNKFMAHIGITFQIVPVSAEDEQVSS